MRLIATAAALVACSLASCKPAPAPEPLYVVSVHTAQCAPDTELKTMGVFAQLPNSQGKLPATEVASGQFMVQGPKGARIEVAYTCGDEPGRRYTAIIEGIDGQVVTPSY